MGRTVSAGVCRDCGADIIWAHTVHGKVQAIDLEPREDGNLATYRDHLGRVQVRVLRDGEEPRAYERRAMPHAATCPRRQPRTTARPDGTVSLAAARDQRRRRRFAEDRGIR